MLKLANHLLLKNILFPSKCHSYCFLKTNSRYQIITFNSICAFDVCIYNYQTQNPWLYYILKQKYGFRERKETWNAQKYTRGATVFFSEYNFRFLAYLSSYVCPRHWPDSLLCDWPWEGCAPPVPEGCVPASAQGRSEHSPVIVLFRLVNVRRISEIQVENFLHF